MTKHRLLFDVQHRSLNVQDIHFLEASAGTGKTFTIEHLVVRLIIEASLSIEKILIVTFTRAATRELKVRIRGALMRTIEMLQGTTSVDYLQAIQEKGKAAIDEAVKKAHAALICFDAAQIFTLHGFCHRMLSEFAFECKIANGLPSPEDAQPAFYYKKAVQDFLLRKLSFHDYSPQQLRILLKKVRNDAFRFIDKVASILTQETQIASYPSLQELYETFTSRLSTLPSIVSEQAIEDFQHLSLCYKGMKGALDEEQLAALLAIVQEKKCSREQFDNLIAEEDWCLDRMLPENLKVKRKEPPHATLHYPGLLTALRQDLLPLIKAAGSPMKTLLRVAKDCQMHAREFLVHLECFSPDQMLRLLDTALDSAPFLEAVRKKYAAAIIDEFQDTDRIQWKIFKRAFLGALDTLCLVGDPKQSIYAFRSADIYTYLDAASALGKETHKYLDTNYRSAPALVHALNQLFSSPKGEGWLALPRIQSTMPVDPVKAGSKEIDSSFLLSRGAIHFFIGSAKRGRGTQWPSNEMEENALFPFIASEIWALKQKRDVPWEEIAVLVKDRFQAMRLLTYFKQHSIPSSFRRGENIASSDALFAFKDCLEAVLNPSDLSALKIALGGTLIGWNETHLRADWNSSLLHRAKIQMQLLQRTLQEKGFGPFFHAFLNHSWFLDDKNIGEKILQRGDLALYQDLRKLAEILIEEEIARKLQGEDFLVYLREMHALAEEQEQRFAIPPTESRGSVSLMTIHLSKGLEFDTVFALALASRHMMKEDDPVKKGPERQWIAFEEADPACLEAMEEIDAEKMRSLYVALTRAKQQLYIPYIIDESGKPLKIGNASPIELFFARMSQECKSSQQLYEEIAQLKLEDVNKILHMLSTSSSLTYDYLDPGKELLPLPSSETSPCVLVVPGTSIFIPEPIRLFSFSSLVSTNTGLIPIAPPLASSDQLPLGAATGTVVHRIFEDIFKRSLQHPLQEKRIEELLACEIADSPLEPFKATLFALVIDSLNLCLLPNAMRLRDVPASQLFCEMEFLFPYEGIAKPQFGSKSALFVQDPDSAQNAYSQSSMSFRTETGPAQKSSNLASKASFAIPSYKKNVMMKGFADLIFLYEDKYYLLDWKTNYLGPSLQDYSQEKIADAMKMHQYFLQASIYAAALKRYVKLFDNRPFEEIFGGAFYVFVRGNAVFHFFPSAEDALL